MSAFIKIGIKVGIAVGVGAALVVGGVYLYNKKFRKTNTDQDDDDQSIDEAIDVDVADEHEFEDSHIREYIAFMSKNGISYDETVSVAETIDNIRIELPEQFVAVKEKMDEIMNSEFDLDKCHEFDKENFRIFYSSIDLDALFKKKGLEIVALGSDHQHSLMTLLDTVTNLQMNKEDSTLEIIYNIYHILKHLNLDDITETTYDEHFKKYVDEVVDVNAEDPTDEESAEESVEPESVES